MAQNFHQTLRTLQTRTIVCWKVAVKLQVIVLQYLTEEVDYFQKGIYVFCISSTWIWNPSGKWDVAEWVGHQTSDASSDM